MGVHGCHESKLYIADVSPYLILTSFLYLYISVNVSQDWKRITSMLLDENPSIELTDDDATNLTRLFGASVKKAVGERIVPAADHRKQNHTKAQRVSE